MTRYETLEALRQRGAATAEVYYSGGHDEGDITSIVLKDAAGKVLQELPTFFAETYYDQGRRITRELTPDEQLASALTEPVYDRYGGFAFESYISGCMQWDVSTGRVVNTADEAYA